MTDLLRDAVYLIVEDVIAVAESIALTLGDFGCDRVEMAGAVDKALQRLDELEPDVVLLDVDLRGESSLPVALELRRRGVPFLFMTGYCSPPLPDELRGAPVLEKPFTGAKLRAAIESLMPSVEARANEKQPRS